MKLHIIFGFICLQTSSSAPLTNEIQHFPVGTIISWMPKNDYDTLIPCGWELCNGQTVEDELSPLFGSQMPPLNTENLFLRGSLEEGTFGMIQADTIPEHGHETLGHTHTDSGHTHMDKGHDHKLKLGEGIPFPVLAPGTDHGDGEGSPRWAATGHYPPFKSHQSKLTQANIEMSHSQISESRLSLSGVVDGRTDSETRPKNVQYPYIMKVRDGDCQYSNVEVSSVVAWLPDEHATESGSWKQSEELNRLEVFLRGGAPMNAGTFEMDSMQEHSHNSLGHTHIDRGHTHVDQGHTHEITTVYDVLRPGSTWGDKDGGPHFGMQIDMDEYFDIGHADIQVSNANIEVGNEMIGNVISTKEGSETRPDNIQLVWIEGNTKLSPEFFPVGSIVAWLPMSNADGQQSLPLGWVECNGEDNKTPDINGNNLFIRGGDSKTAGRLQEFQIQNHKHNDLGHTHGDAGHSHVDSGHNLGEYFILIPGDDYGDENGSPHFADDVIIDIFTSTSSKADLGISKAEIQVTKAVVKDVTHAKTSEEVRPKNMAVKFIMKIY